MDEKQALEFLKELFFAAFNSARPEVCIPANLPKPPLGRTIVIGFGKASAIMAQALEQNWPGPLQGTVVTKYGHAAACKNIKILQAAHPTPDDASQIAAEEILKQVENLNSDDLVICLISGGGSSLMCLPHAGINLDDKQLINQQLLNSGATISEINCVRRHLSAIKGGKLALACYPAKLINLIISDVPGDGLSDIASGPTVPDYTNCADALNILHRYKIEVPKHITQILKTGKSETLKPDSHVFEKVQSKLIATPLMALQAAADLANKQGIQAHILSDQIEGEAKEVGKVLANIAKHVKNHNQPFQRPCVILSGGETSVTVMGNGLGGRNVECLLSTAIQLNGESDIYALYADTDGMDGQADIAGAFIKPNTIDCALNLEMSAQKYLYNNDGHNFFGKLGDSLVTGPTLTNVNDFRVLLIL